MNVSWTWLLFLQAPFGTLAALAADLLLANLGTHRQIEMPDFFWAASLAYGLSILFKIGPWIVSASREG
jgi:hypothetical protein